MTAPRTVPNGRDGATPPVVLAITLAPDGSVKVEGPVHDKMLCYALLENARDAVKDFTDAQTASKIVQPDASDIIALSSRRPH